MKRVKASLCAAVFALFLSQTAASSGLLFNVSATGTPANLSITLCLNGNGPLSCQNYTVSALNLSISTTIPNYVYPAVGIRVNTPGYVLAGCLPVANGYCLFSANSTTSTSIAVSSTSAFFVGGTVSGLSGTVVLQNNGGDSQTISSNGPFTFSTPVTAGEPYAVTVLTQPADQTCTVSNSSGTMGSANVTNVTVVCSTNTYTVGGTVSGLIGTVTLQNNSTNSTPISSNGSFTFSTPIAEGSTYNVTVQTRPVEQTCTVTNGSGTIGSSNVTNVSVSCATNTTTITVSSNGTIPVNVASGSLTVTNTGTTYDAYNVSASLPGGWTGVTEDATDCTVISPNGGTCTLTFTSTTPYVAQGGITVTGDNITSPPTTALAFSMNGYLVWSVSGTSPSATALVIGRSDAPSAQVWSTDFVNILGIYETSQAPPCNGATDGACDTGQIVAYYDLYDPTPYTDYAAGLCYQIPLDNSGNVTIGTWYLPAICQMGGAGQGASCSSGLANIDTNLVQLGFGGLSGSYWSSTEYSGNPTSGAWLEGFASGSGSGQVLSGKNGHFSVRCARAFTY